VEGSRCRKRPFVAEKRLLMDFVSKRASFFGDTRKKRGAKVKNVQVLLPSSSSSETACGGDLAQKKGCGAKFCCGPSKKNYQRFQTRQKHESKNDQHLFKEVVPRNSFMKREWCGDQSSKNNLVAYDVL